MRRKPDPAGVERGLHGAPAIPGTRPNPDLLLCDQVAQATGSIAATRFGSAQRRRIMLKAALFLLLVTGGATIPEVLLADPVDTAPDEPVAPPRGTETAPQPGWQTGKPHPKPESRPRAPAEGKASSSSDRLRKKRD
jgi:hypothetical protein